MWSGCISIIAHMVRVSHDMLHRSMVSTWPVCLSTIAHMVRVSHDILYRSMVSTWPVCLSTIAHVVRVSHDMLHPFMLSTWSEWIRMNQHNCPCGQSVSAHIAHVVRASQYVVSIYGIPCGQSVSPYVVSVHVVTVHVVHMLRMNQHISPIWSECLTICCISPCCPHAQNESARMPPYCQSVSRYVVSVYVVYMLGLNQHDCPMWSDCITIYCHVVRVYHDMLYGSIVSACSE